MIESTQKLPRPEIDIVDLQERTWLARHCRGDAGAFAQLLNAYRRPIYNYLVRCGLDSATRDDLFQDIFLKIHSKAATYEASKPLRPWIFTIALNTVRNYWRDTSKRDEVLDHAMPEQAAQAQPSTRQQAEHHESLERLAVAITRLPVAQREVLVMVTIEGLALKEVAEVLRLPVNSVKTRLRRARLALIEMRDGDHDLNATPTVGAPRP